MTLSLKSGKMPFLSYLCLLHFWPLKLANFCKKLPRDERGGRRGVVEHVGDCGVEERDGIDAVDGHFGGGGGDGLVAADDDVGDGEEEEEDKVDEAGERQTGVSSVSDDLDVSEAKESDCMNGETEFMYSFWYWIILSDQLKLLYVLICL